MDEQLLTEGTEAPAISEPTTTPATEAAPTPSIDPAPTEIKDDVRSLLEASVKEAKERDEKGRFVSKEGKPEQAAPVEKPAEQAAAPAAEAPKAVDYPQSWATEERKIFESLPDAAKNTILRRERELVADYHRKTHRIAAAERRFSGIESVIAPHEEGWRLSGHTPEAVIGQLVTAQKKLDSDPIAGTAIIMQSYGITPQDLYEHMQGGGQQNTELASVKAELQQLRSQLEERGQYQQQTAQSQRIAEIAAFAQAVDQSGQRLRPHFDSVSPIVERLIGPLAKQNPHLPLTAILQDAYDQAVWANPQTREAALQKERETQAARLLEEQKQKAEKAKKAASSINGTPGGGNSSNGPAGDDVRSTILWAMNQQN